MRLRSHVVPLNVAGVVSQLGRLLLVLGGLLVAPLGVALVSREWAEAGIFAGLAASCGAAGFLAARRRADDIGLREGLVITALAYLLFAAVGAVPFLRVAGPVDAFFESMSGFTTTGLTVIPVRSLDSSLLFFRSYSQWVGGAGIVILSLSILLRTSRAAHRLYASEFGEENLVGSVTIAARAIAGIYLILTAAVAGAFALGGLDPFRAVLYALTAVSTGGFSPDAGGLADAPVGAAVRSVAVVAMIVGAISFTTLARLWSTGPRCFLADWQLRSLVLLAAIGTAVFLAEGSHDPLGSLFNATSTVTTTGFSVTSPADWAATERLLAIGLMLIGGSAGSTAGGFKLYRLGVLVRMTWWTLVKTVLPERATLAVTYSGTPVRNDELRRIGTLLALYISILFMSATAVAATGASAGDAIFEVASALGTVGLSVGIADADLVWWAKLVLALDMWLGRLEILPVIVLVFPPNWKL